MIGRNRHYDTMTFSETQVRQIRTNNEQENDELNVFLVLRPGSHQQKPEQCLTLHPKIFNLSGILFVGKTFK